MANRFGLAADSPTPNFYGKIQIFLAGGLNWLFNDLAQFKSREITAVIFFVNGDFAITFFEKPNSGNRFFAAADGINITVANPFFL